mgnify:CR=1 FL=1
MAPSKPIAAAASRDARCAAEKVGATAVTAKTRPPLVRNTGGLADTVIDCNKVTLANGTANGFVFDDATPEALLGTIRRAVTAWHDKALWHTLQRNGMVLDFSWSSAATAYRAIYTKISLKKKTARTTHPAV